MPTLANGFVLGTLSLLASGYIVYDAPICRLWWRMVTGYALYFRTIVAGLFVTLFLATPLYTLLAWKVPDCYLILPPEYALALAFPVALFLRLLAKGVFWVFGKCNPERKYQLDLEKLNEWGRIVYQKAQNKKMVMVTMESNKVYIGWTAYVFNREDNRWLRLAPLWSGYRDENSMINITTYYSAVHGAQSSEQDHTLLSVEKIVTIQPFDPDTYKKFNPDITATT